MADRLPFGGADLEQWVLRRVTDGILIDAKEAAEAAEAEGIDGKRLKRKGEGL